jgi:pheromone receptor transcription factor
MIPFFFLMASSTFRSALLSFNQFPVLRRSLPFTPPRTKPQHSIPPIAATMVKEIRRIEDEDRCRCCFKDRSSTLFAVAKKLSEDFGAHVAVVAFSPKGEPRAFGSPTADSVLRTSLSEAAPPPPSSGSSAETAEEAAARVVGMRRETEETKALVAAEWARVAAAMEKVRAAQASAGKRNWWEVDVEALGEVELPVFVRALEMLRADVQDRIDATASARLPLPWKEKKLQ